MPSKDGSPGRTRTNDKMINSHLLYQLSYQGFINFKQDRDFDLATFASQVFSEIVLIIPNVSDDDFFNTVYSFH